MDLLRKHIPAAIWNSGRHVADKIFPMYGAEPIFMIIGAQKSGTTSLHSWLNQHPKLAGTSPKELHFFDRDHKHLKERRDYEMNFRRYVRLKSVGAFESTPNYIYVPGCAERIRAMYPNIRLIVTLRNPVDRAVSAWRMYRILVSNGYFKPEEVSKRKILPGNESHKHLVAPDGSARTLSELIDIELKLPEAIFEPGIVRRGFYLDQLKQVWRSFPRDQVFITGMGRLKHDAPAVLREICDFVGIDPAPVSEFQLIAKHQRAEKDKVPCPAETIARLHDIYERPNKELFDEIGPLDW